MVFTQPLPLEHPAPGALDDEGRVAVADANRVVVAHFPHGAQKPEHGDVDDGDADQNAEKHADSFGFLATRHGLC